MKLKQVGKISAINLVMILLLMNLFGVDFCTSSSPVRVDGIQPYNSFKDYIWGGLGEQTNLKYGWNLTYIENLNGDAYPDLVIGTPWYDSGPVNDIGKIYIFYGKPNIGFDDINYTNADVTIIGDGVDNKFGWDVSDAGDINNDGINDLIVGAPGALQNRGRAYLFYGGTIPVGTSSATTVASRILIGKTVGGYYGSSVAGIGDINNDGYDDVAVGAPGADHVIITYGYKNKMILYPNIWDDDETSKGIIKFDKGCNNSITDSNTWGLDGDDDGWDWVDSFHDPTQLYGQTSPAPFDHANIYGPWEPDGPDADGRTFKNRTALEIMIGRNHTDLNPYINTTGWDAGASAGWGIEFNITSEMNNLILTNSTITLSFDYTFVDTNKLFHNTNNTRVPCMIRSRLWNSSNNKVYLGEFESARGKCVLYRGSDPWGTPAWGPIHGHFETPITDYIDHVGAYYWDFGCYLDRYLFYEDDGIAAFFDNITMKISNEKSIIIEGSKKSGFGTSIAAVGDIDGDGYPDILIGAPYLDSGYAALLPGKKKYKEIESISLAKIILTGKNYRDRFGYSLSSAGDVDNDGKTDIIIGAPGGNYANLYYGNTLNKPLLVPDLSENDEEKGTPQLEFDSGVKTTGNTPGLSAADDGWDSWNGVYGYESGESPGSAVTYNGVNSIDSQEIADDDELIIYIGGNLGGGGFYGAKPDSGAYGVKFSVSSEMITAIESGAEAVLSYDWHFKNFGLDQDDTIWIKTFIRSNTKDYSLGWALDKDTVNNNNKDTTNEIHWSEIPEDINSIFVQGCSECFSTQDSYYLDIGAKVGDWYWEAGAYEDGGFYFDNLYLRINPAPDKQFIGPEESGFGFGVGYSDKLNMDDYGDIVISAPYYDSPNGNDSGAVFGFLTNPIFGKIQLAENAEFVTYGEHTGDNLGWTLLGVKSCDSDEFSEIITTAINYDYSAMTDVGRLYLLSISKGPRIRLLYPIGSEILSGNVTINAAVIDPDENIDNNEGVYFYYSSDTKLKDWIEIGRDNTPADENNIYEHYWDTSMLPDGTKYFVKAWVQDEDLHKGENISRAITIDNPHPPTIKILTPAAESNISGKVDIVAQIKDSVLDKIGGGIDYDRGVEFYFSDDMASWELLYVDHTKKWKETPDIYQTQIKLNDFPDGEYWIKVNATDWDGFEVEKTIKVNLNNRDREPSIKLITPNIPYQELSGTIPVKASAFDFDGNINSSGITYYMLSWELFILEQIEKWNKIGNAPEFEINLTGSHVYSYEFDTTLFKDGIYKLKAFVNDSTGLTNETESIFIIIHNKQNNPPFIKLTYPIPGSIVGITDFITAIAWDLEKNINEQSGVLFYYSTDKTHWKYLGNIPKPSEIIDVIRYYKYTWYTDTIPDGEYWLNVSVSDEDGLTSWDVPDEPIIIHNRNTNPPIARFVTPTAGQYINNTFGIQVYANDLEDKVDKLRVSLYITSDLKLDEWVSIASANILNANDKLFGYSWDTTSFSDGKYWLKAVVLDTNDQEGIAISDYFYIHNKLDNPPIVQFLGPHSGEVKGTIKLNASVFDLENNLDDNGVYFEYSTNPTDTKTWTLIGNDLTPYMEGLDNIYEFFWDTTKVPDNLYWLRARATDKTSLEGKDTSDSFIIVHNNLNNPPILKLILPSKDAELSDRQTIKVEIIDFENDVETVSFYYSKDQEAWKPIESKINVDQEGNYFYYTTMWDTTELTGEIYLNARAIDKLGNSNQIIEGPFKTGKGATGGGDEEKASQDYMLWIVIIIIVIIMVLAIVLLLRRSKRREEELIEEVAAEAQRSQVLEGEIISTPDMAASMMGAPSTVEGLQTYIPPQGLAPQPTAAAPQLPAYQPELDVETIESYNNQLNTWKMEGYNVSRLEQLSMTDEDMFARTFPIFSSNITRLKNISGKINTMDTTGYDAEVDSINSKLYEPDQALAVEQEFKQLENRIMSSRPGAVPQPEGVDDILPQLLPGETAPQDSEIGGEPTEGEQVQDMDEPVQESDTPLDVDLPPDVEVPEEQGQEVKKETESEEE